MQTNHQDPPVTEQNLIDGGCSLWNNTDVYNAKGEYVGKFEDVEWGHGASGMLFINHEPITVRPCVHPVTPVIWGGPMWRDAFNEHDLVFIEELNRRGTIVSGTMHAQGLEDAVLVEFDSGKGLPGNDSIQTVPTSQLKKVG